MAAYAISNVPRRVVYAASGVGPYAFTFEILVNTDVAVYRDDTLLTLTTDYTVAIAANGTGTVTLTASPTGATQIAIVGSRAIQRTSDFVTGGDFFANTVNDELDSLTIFAQQNAEAVARALQAPQTDPTNIDMTLPRAADRAGKYLAFDEDGNPKPGDTAIDVEAVAAIANEVEIVADNIASVNTNATNIVAIQNASANAAAAAASASAAAASYDSFDDRYLGVKTTNPTLDNDGNALLTGAIYFNSAASEMRVYTGSAWQVATAAPNAVIEYEFTATAGQTTYSFAGQYNVGFLYVWVNGALLADADITATDGTNITFASALSLGDEVRVMTFKALGSVTIDNISGLQAAFDAKADLTSPTLVTPALGTPTSGNLANTVGLPIDGGTTGTLPVARGGTGATTFASGALLKGAGTGAVAAASAADIVGQIGVTAVQNATTAQNTRRGGGNVANNVANGELALTANTSGFNNTANGYQALSSNTTGASNTANGAGALSSNTTGASNTATGGAALLFNTTGANNTATGEAALQNNTVGTNNTANGHQALFFNTTGANNTAVGSGALRSNTTESQNTATGSDALRDNQFFLNCSGFGFNAQITGSNQVQLGNSSTTTYVYGTVQNRSDLRDKADVRDTVLGLSFINALRPVDYKWDMREDYRPERPADLPADSTPEQEEVHKAEMAAWLEAVKQDNLVTDGSKKRNRYHHGLIAQEVKELLDAQGIDFGGYQDHKISGGHDVLSIGYDELIAPLIKAVQELTARVKQLEQGANT
jgi:hypothetical protein